ncbi:MAG: hypothetical protein LBD50_01515 [Rickettsiales bacterium]|jgi:hypothetical protein|nr:hypothetical protein [Rickettsiales bacterium]
MAGILERNKKLNIPKKTQEEYTEDALYREVWEDVNNEKTQLFLKKYSRHLIAGALVILIAVVGVQLIRHQNRESKIGAARNYETAAMNMDARALAALGQNSSGATADLALFQSFMTDGDISKLERLAQKGNSRDFRDLATMHLAAAKGDSMPAKDFEKFMSPLNTKSSPFYYTGLLMVAQKHLADGDKAAADVWLDKIISDPDAPAVIAANAEILK